MGCVWGSVLQGLKAFDTSVESITTGTWQALGSAWKSGSLIVQKYSPLFLISISLSALIPESLNVCLPLVMCCILSHE
jgi:hypothetical protein